MVGMGLSYLSTHAWHLLQLSLTYTYVSYVMIIIKLIIIINICNALKGSIWTTIWTYCT